MQRVYLHSSIYDRFLEQFLPEVRKLKLGDPLDETTDVGPVIDARAADQIESWVHEALAAGAKVLIGSRRVENLWEPTVLGSVREDLHLSCREAFGPLVNVYRYDDIDEALQRVDNISRCG